MGKLEDTWIYLLFGIAGISTLLFVMALIQYNKAGRILKRLEEMLAEAKKDTLSEKEFDESRLSRFETGFCQYFKSSILLKKKILSEQDKIKMLIGDISHQTKTPVANILLYVQLLSEQDLNPEEQKIVGKIEGQTEKLRFLIDALVKTSRLETGVIRVVPRYEKVSIMLKEIVKGVEQKCREKDIKISFSLPAEEVYAFFDPKWTQEAIENIVDNAVKYTPSGGFIGLHVIKYDMFVRIDINDTGIGIKEEEQAEIFKRFYRSERVSHVEGAGIGLFLTRQILTEEDAYIKVSNRREGGSCFSVFLPLHDN